MKITRENLKNMILQEMATTLSPKDNKNRMNVMYRNGPFKMLVQSVWDTLDKLEESIRQSGDLEPVDLEGLKNSDLQRLNDKLQIIYSVIDHKLAGRIE